MKSPIHRSASGELFECWHCDDNAHSQKKANCAHFSHNKCVAHKAPNGTNVRWPCAANEHISSNANMGPSDVDIQFVTASIIAFFMDDSVRYAWCSPVTRSVYSKYRVAVKFPFSDSIELCSSANCLGKGLSSSVLADLFPIVLILVHLLSFISFSVYSVSHNSRFII